MQSLVGLGRARGIGVCVAVDAEEVLGLEQLVGSDADGVERRGKERLGVLGVEFERGSHEG